MPDVKEFLPIIIPFVIVQLVLLAYVLHHVFTHDTYKRGSRAMWVAICIIGMEFIGPIAYLLIGKEDA